MFAAHLEAFTAQYRRMWRECGTEPPALEGPVDVPHQRRNEREADEFIRWLQDWTRDYSSTEPGLGVWRSRVMERCERFCRDALGFPDRCRQILFSAAYRQSTAEFLRQAKAFNPTLEVDDLFQAIRNVWIANSIQLLLDREIALTGPLFAYSLLYPYTDNYLDDPEVPRAAKQALSECLTQWLDGLPVPPCSPHQRDILRLVDVIHRTYPAAAYLEVHDSLRAIHRAQVGSLAQQSPPRFRDEAELLQISVEKGGTSVLTDGYLVAGRLSRQEAEFLFGYGVVLQLLDDLQDIRRDLRVGHATLFTRAATRGPLDALANRLHDFLQRVLHSSDRFTAQRFAALKELLERSCGLLLLHAVAASPEFFTGAYSRQLEACSPFRFRFIRERRATLEKACQKAKGRLDDRHHWEAFLCALDEPGLPSLGGAAPVRDAHGPDDDSFRCRTNSTKWTGTSESPP